MGPFQHVPAALEAWLFVTCRSCWPHGARLGCWGSVVLHAPYPMAQ